ncbi:hypothetical protein F5878DRAFT_669025 [Lentinula raphanica]|uniref:Uncharacterized protein n=1 Tax=Lentinula raphanica TaxID=153919 RepID=A0AA38UB65_9AGAR|nr:hypothetical protein F5878DRAFT_669025 [Lentinula raphanica]
MAKPIFHSPLEATLEQLFATLVQIVIRRDNEIRGQQVRRMTLEEIKVVEYFAHIPWNEHEQDETEMDRRAWWEATTYAAKLQQTRINLRETSEDGVARDREQVTVGGFVPFEFFLPTKSFWMGPYAEKWSLRVVRPSPPNQLHWNNPFDFSDSINYSTLMETIPETIHRVPFTPSDRRNQFFSRRPLDSTTRRDFSVRFLYEETDYVLLGDEVQSVLFYHIIFRRDIDFTLDELEYESHVAYIRRSKSGPRSTLYAFDWNHNIVEHKVHHRFYQHWLDEERKKWVVRERGSGKFVRGRRNAIEQEAFKMWMSRQEDIHPAWQGSLKAFQAKIDEATDDEWQMDNKERIRHAYEYWPSLMRGA